MTELYDTLHQPLPITNEGFIAGEEPDPLERIYEESTMDSYWDDMAQYAPREANVYGRNASLIRITERVVKGEAQMTGSIRDMRQLCELYFERQGSINPLRGTTAPDRLLKVAGRYLELCSTDKEHLDDKSIPYGDLPAYVARLFKSGEIDTVVRQLDGQQQMTFATMLAEISYAYGNNIDIHGDRAAALRNTFENWALHVFRLVNGTPLSGTSAPDFLTRHKQAAWASQYDIRFAQIGRIQDEAERDQAYKRLLSQQMAEAGVMLRAAAIPTGRAIDGILYEYFLPVSIRFNALVAEQQDKVLVRRATQREDAPIDGMTHPTRTQDYDRYSFDMLVSYPQHARLVFLQTKLGQDTAGYDEGVQVYNYHTNEPEIRRYMAAAVEAMQAFMNGDRVTPDMAARLRKERMRIAPLLPDSVD